METPNQKHREMAQAIKNWLPRPIWIHKPGEMARVGPGAELLQKHNIMGYSAIHTIAEGRPTRKSQLPKIEKLHKIMLAEHQQVSKMSERDEKDNQHAELLSNLPDLNELEERLDSLRAIQKQQGQALFEIKSMLEQLLRELGVKKA